MEKTKIFIDGIEKDVYGIFYIYESNYYFIYTEKELDGDNYVVLYMTKVGKETKNTENGLVETGYMIGVQIDDPTELKKAQESVSYIVEDKKNNTVNSNIQYLPINMMSNIKILSKKRLRLLKTILEDKFNLTFESNSSPSELVQQVIEPITPAVEERQEIVPQAVEQVQPEVENSNVEPVEPMVEPVQPSNEYTDISVDSDNSNVIIDYRAKYFELEEKNKQLQSQIDILTEKLNEIKIIVE